MNGSAVSGLLLLAALGLGAAGFYLMTADDGPEFTVKPVAVRDADQPKRASPDKNTSQLPGSGERADRISAPLENKGAQDANVAQGQSGTLNGKATSGRAPAPGRPADNRVPRPFDFPNPNYRNPNASDEAKGDEVVVQDGGVVVNEDGEIVNPDGTPSPDSPRGQGDTVQPRDASGNSTPDSTTPRIEIPNPTRTTTPADGTGENSSSNGSNGSDTSSQPSEGTTYRVPGVPVPNPNSQPQPNNRPTPKPDAPKPDAPKPDTPPKADPDRNAPEVPNQNDPRAAAPTKVRFAVPATTLIAVNQTVTVDIDITQPEALQHTGVSLQFLFPSSCLRFVSATKVDFGSADARKDLTSSNPSEGVLTILCFGMNQALIPSGAKIRLNFEVTRTMPAGWAGEFDMINASSATPGATKNPVEVVKGSVRFAD